MSEIDDLKEKVAVLESQVAALMKAVYPNTPRTRAEIQAEVHELVERFGKDGAAAEIARRHRLRQAS